MTLDYGRIFEVVRKMSLSSGNEADLRTVQLYFCDSTLKPFCGISFISTSSKCRGHLVLQVYIPLSIGKHNGKDAMVMTLGYGRIFEDVCKMSLIWGS